jgi:hypothetical protein
VLEHERAGEGPDAQSDRPSAIDRSGVDAFAERLSAHVRAHRDASLEVHEQGVLNAWRAEGAAVLGGVVAAATTARIAWRAHLGVPVQAVELVVQSRVGVVGASRRDWAGSPLFGRATGVLRVGAPGAVPIGR